MACSQVREGLAVRSLGSRKDICSTGTGCDIMPASSAKIYSSAVCSNGRGRKMVLLLRYGVPG